MALAWGARWVPYFEKNGEAFDNRSSIESVLTPNDPPLTRGRRGSRLLPGIGMINFMKKPSLCDQSRSARASSVALQRRYFVPLVKLIRQTRGLSGEQSSTLSEESDGHSCRLLFIVDWDDTLNASTWCVQRGIHIVRQPSVQERSQLNSLSLKCADTLALLMKYGHVVIVTNAEEGWVQTSAKSLLPEVSK